MEYKLSEKALHAINNHPTIIGKLLGLNNRNDTRTVKTWIKLNEPNGPLTAKGNVDLISELTGLKDVEILIQCNSQHQPHPYPIEMNEPTSKSEK